MEVPRFIGTESTSKFGIPLFGILDSSGLIT